MTCSVPGCQNGVHSRGLCRLHYCRMWRTGSTEKKLREAEADTGEMRTLSEMENDLAKAEDALAHLPFGSPQVGIWVAEKRELMALISAEKAKAVLKEA